jgi:transposase
MEDQNLGKNLAKLKIEEKASILAWRRDKIPIKVIAERLGRHKASIHRFLAHSKTVPKEEIFARKKGSGRPRKMTPEKLGALERQIKKYPMMTTVELKQTVPNLDGVSDRTVQRSLTDYLKMPSRSAALKPLLTDKMKKKRLQFARAYSHFTAEDWSRVMYSDESTFRCIRSTRTKVRRPSGSNRFESKFTVKTVKHPDSVMIWGCFSGSVGRGGLFFLPKNTTMNGERYQEVLESHLLPFMRIHRCTHFLQDGAPCHASKRIKDYLKDKPFEVIDWPGNSPDLNPIENMWNFMKNQLKKVDTNSVPKLITEIKLLWTTGITQEYCRKLSDSMPRRLQKVIEAKGESTGY